MKVGVLRNDILDKERADNLRSARNEDILDDCAKESRGKTTDKNTTHDTCGFNDVFFLNYFLYYRSKRTMLKSIYFLTMCDYFKFNF